MDQFQVFTDAIGGSVGLSALVSSVLVFLGIAFCFGGLLRRPA